MQENTPNKEVQLALANQKLNEYKQRYWLAEKEYLFYNQPTVNEPDLKKQSLDVMKKFQEWINYWQSVIDELEKN